MFAKSLRVVSKNVLSKNTIPSVQLASNQVRFLSELKSIFEKQIPEKQAEVKELRQKHGDKVLTQSTVDMAYMGMRGIKGLVTETSLLDAEEGIRFRGLSIPECQQRLPKAEGGSEPLPEAMIWLLVTGQVPTQEQVKALTEDLHRRSSIDKETEDFIKSIPNDYHPMTQFSMAILALQKSSKFANAYYEGINKKLYWDPVYEDVLDCIAKLPHVASIIYRKTFHNGQYIESNPNLDWAANYAHMMGYEGHEVNELFRLYMTIHSDHEGGNVSAHTTHLVGSALSDPYFSLSAGMNGLAGPLHGLANQEVLRFLKELEGQLKGEEPTKENLTKLIWDVLNSGRVVPGYGHAVLRKTDPRYSSQREFALKYMKDDKLFKLVSTLYDIIPGILTEHGKTKNPFPNVDAHSGCLLQHYGIVEEDYYTVMFGVSRAIGVLSSLLIDRSLGLPLERPKSITTEWIKNQFEKQ